MTLLVNYICTNTFRTKNTETNVEKDTLVFKLSIESNLIKLKICKIPVYYEYRQLFLAVQLGSHCWKTAGES